MRAKSTTLNTSATLNVAQKNSFLGIPEVNEHKCCFTQFYYRNNYFCNMINKTLASRYSKTFISHFIPHYHHHHYHQHFLGHTVPNSTSSIASSASFQLDFIRNIVVECCFWCVAAQKNYFEGDNIDV